MPWGAACIPAAKAISNETADGTRSEPDALMEAASLYAQHTPARTGWVQAEGAVGGGYLSSQNVSKRTTS